jgi:large subunit ribosomal protein L10
MALRLEQKQALVAEVAEVAQSSHSAVAAEYRGLTVEQMTELRANARATGVYLRVVKNTLAKRAIEGTDFACLEETLRGPILLAFSREDPGAAARLVKKFSKDNEHLVAVSVAIGGQAYPAGDLDRVAKLPTRDEALAMLAGLMRAPVEKFVRTLAEPHAKLVRTVAAVRDQKQAA